MSGAALSMSPREIAIAFAIELIRHTIAFAQHYLHFFSPWRPDPKVDTARRLTFRADGQAPD
jgi:hypothetical protein